MKNILTVLFCLIVGGMQAQIFQVNSSTAALYAVSTLMDGYKWLAIPYGGAPWTTVTLYNDDLTTYASVALPAPPPGYNYTSAPSYFTEALFDLDSTNFEFVMPINNGSSTGVRIIREDGTVLFNRTTEFLPVSAGGTPFNGFSFIMPSPSGTYMSLANGQGGSVLYLLPGELPCFTCSGLMLSTGTQEQVAPNGFRIAPNPSATQVTLELEAIDAVGAELVVTASDGKVVRTMILNERRQVVLDVQDLATGTYQVTMVTRSGQKHTGRFVVAR